MNLKVMTLALAGLSCLVSAASAGATETRVGKSGAPFIVAAYWQMNRETCNSAPPPQIKVLTPPAHGTVDIVLTNYTVPKSRTCAGSVAKLRYVLYHPSKGYRGPDSVTIDTSWEIYTNGVQRGGETETVPIEVK